LSSLAADRPHLVELDAPGMKPWTKQVDPVRGATVEVEATLEPAPLDPERPAEPVVAVGGDRNALDEVPAGPTTPAVASAKTAELRVDAAAAAVSIPASRAARVRLDPKKTYKLSVEGSATLDDVARTRGCFYFVERSARESGPAFGWIGPKESVKLTGARVLYGFVVDPSPGDNTGQLVLSAHEGKSAVKLLVDARFNAVFPPSNRGARFTSLGSSGHYTLELQGKANLGAGAGPAERAVFWYDGTVDLKQLQKNPELTHGVIRAGEKISLENPSSVVLFVPDDDLVDNAGAFVASIHPLKK
jgi:hypothetical protein